MAPAAATTVAARSPPRSPAQTTSSNGPPQLPAARRPRILGHGQHGTQKRGPCRQGRDFEPFRRTQPRQAPAAAAGQARALQPGAGKDQQRHGQYQQAETLGHPVSAGLRHQGEAAAGRQPDRQGAQQRGPGHDRRRDEQEQDGRVRIAQVRLAASTAIGSPDQHHQERLEEALVTRLRQERPPAAGFDPVAAAVLRAGRRAGQRGPAVPLRGSRARPPRQTNPSGRIPQGRWPTGQARGCTQARRTTVRASNRAPGRCGTGAAVTSVSLPARGAAGDERPSSCCVAMRTAAPSSE